MKVQPDAAGQAGPGSHPGSGHRARMRERMFAAGAESFHDHELLEYVLALANRRSDTKALARQLIAEFGSFASVISAEPEALMSVKGLGDTGVGAIKFVQAAALRMQREAFINKPVLSSWSALIDYCHADMAHSISERFRVLFLNNRNILIKDEVMSEGTVNHAPVYVREVIKRALELGATAMILVHNHPSGDPKPSKDDIAMTREIINAGRPMSIEVHDHVIIGRNGHASMKAMGLI